MSYITIWNNIGYIITISNIMSVRNL